MKRTPIKRSRSPLKRKKPLRAKKFCELRSAKPLTPERLMNFARPMASLRPSKAASRAKFRREVMKKNGGWCVRCNFGVMLAESQVAWTGFSSWIKATDPHHWKPIGRGGTDDPKNGLPMCRECHDWIHQNTVFAEAEGWLLGRGPKNENALKIEKWMEGR